MIQFKRKFYFFKVNETWFDLNYSVKNIFSFRSYSFIDKKLNSFLSFFKENKSTIIIDLENNPDVIKNSFNGNLRRDIKNAELHNIKCIFMDNKDIFIQFFNEFAKLKNIYEPKKNTIDAFGENFLTSFAIVDDKILVAHSYVIDKQKGIAFLFQSASKRLDSNFDKTIISRANKLLTYHDIMHFKNVGFKKYDFGGYVENTKNKSLIGINQFKLSFGGEVKRYYIYYTPILFLLIKASRFLDRRFQHS
jgi:lipid II:glycine glycyltransferase (peptidoglycan interpeptide bridge formation enzyme)